MQVTDRMIDCYLDTAQEMQWGRFPKREKAVARKVLEAFFEYAKPLIDAVPSTYDDCQFGVDFWLARTGAGVSFDDRLQFDIPPVEGWKPRCRDGMPFKSEAKTLGEQLDEAAYGGADFISPFAYPSTAVGNGGWLFIEGSAETWASLGQAQWRFWRLWANNRK